MRRDHYVSLNEQPRRRAIVWLLPVLLCLMAVRLLPFEPVRSLNYILSKPLWAVRDAAIGVYADVRTSLTTKATLEQENAALRLELVTAQREAVYARTLSAERWGFLELLGRTSAYGGVVPAVVVNAADLSPYGTFVLDVGRAGGIQEQMLVTTPERLVLGVITHAYDDYSTARLFGASGTHVDGMVLAGPTVSVSLSGVGAGTLIGELPRDVHVSVGDTVVLPGLDVMVLGYVAQIVAQREDAYQRVYVRPAADASTVPSAFVWTSLVWQVPEALQVPLGTSTAPVYL